MTGLSRRLQTIADFVTDGSAVLDVGCDHAFLSIQLLKSGKVPCALCSDINEGPLKGAGDHIRAEHLENRAQLVRVGGIPRNYQDLLPEIPYTGISVVIAGMGGALMGKILLDARDLLPSMREYILAPQSELMKFRSTLLALNLRIAEERFVSDEGKYYTVMRAVPSPVSLPEMSREELQYGPCLIREKDPVLHRYLLKRKEDLMKIEKNIAVNAGAGAGLRMMEIRDELARVEKVLGIMEDPL